MTVPDFSPFADLYAASRPRYPDALFAELAALAPGRRLAWDCATGNGQAAAGLLGHFRRVIATDVSREQIARAPRHPRLESRVATAEHCGLADGSVDLVTVAAALHWFDLDAFFAEARRVARRGGVLAVWTYHVGHVDPPFDAVFLRLYGILRPYFADRVRLVDERYATVALPGEPLEVGDHRMEARWDLDRMLAFIASWSGARTYRERNGADPVDLVADELRRLWGRPEASRTVRWPLFVRACRLGR